MQPSRQRREPESASIRERSAPNCKAVPASKSIVISLNERWIWTFVLNQDVAGGSDFPDCRQYFVQCGLIFQQDRVVKHQNSGVGLICNRQFSNCPEATFSVNAVQAAKARIDRDPFGTDC